MDTVVVVRHLSPDSPSRDAPADHGAAKRPCFSLKVSQFHPILSQTKTKLKSVGFEPVSF